MGRPKKIVATETPPQEPKEAVPNPFGTDVTLIWIERLERLYQLPLNHQGVPERIQVYLDRIERETGTRPTTMEALQQLKQDIKG
jgi:hypothetical protein